MLGFGMWSAVWKQLVFCGGIREIPGMSIVTADDYKRIRIPDAKPGQSFAYESTPEGIKLTPIKKAEPRTVTLKLVKRGQRLVPDLSGLTIDPKDIGRAVREERDTERGIQS